MTISEIKKNARKALTGKWGKGAVIVLAYLAINFAIGFVLGFLGESNIADFISTLLEVPLTFGLTYAFIKLARNEETKAFDFLELGFSNFGRSWKIALRTALKIIVPLILLFISIILISVGISVTMTSSLIQPTTGTANSSMAGLGFIGIAFIVLIIACIGIYVKSLLYSLTTYIAYDNPNMNSKEVVAESEKLMKGNRGKFFVLMLSFIGWAFLSILVLGIGLLWLIPYMQISYMCFYEKLTKKEDNENI